MTRTLLQPASLPEQGLPDLNPAWSRLVCAPDADGVVRSWHILDSHVGRDEAVELTLLCVHGNPTWSYLWRKVLASAPRGVRVVAVDQLDMGYSERTGTVRRLADRIEDLSSLTDELGISGPVITVAHDWGGPISLGWALRHRDQLRGVVLLNTAVHQPAGAPAPSIIRLARSTPLLHANTVATPAFVRGTTALSGRSMSRGTADAFAAPYRGADRRVAVGTFVADIPLESDHPSAATLDSIAEAVRGITEVPVLLMWGPGDPVFSDRYLNDLIDRMPQADVHRYEGARHLVIEDAPTLVDDLFTWIADLGRPAPSASATEMTRPPLWSALEERAARTPDDVALAVPHESGGWRLISWCLLARNVDSLARGLSAKGIRSGDRVAVLVPPGGDLIACVYACWRIGATVVVTDAGLGVRGIHRALRGTDLDYVIGIPRALVLVRAMRLPAALIATADLAEIARTGAGRDLPEPPGDDDEAVVVFTSGSTGPAKGVVYLHRQVQTTRDLLIDHYGITSADALVAAFAPWAVLGPAIGIASSIPDMDVTSPRTLEADALADAVRVVDGTLLWASPAAFTNVLATSGSLTDDQRQAFESLRLVLGAGAPVSAALLHGMADLCPGAQVRTPYGMTEALPVCDVTIAEIDAAGPGPGVLVGRPLPGVDVRISAVDDDGRAVGPLSADPGVLGEIVVSGAHVKERYDRLWATQRASARDAGWHRTGDIGRLDEQGRLWVDGRLGHIITTPDGPIGPVGVEQLVQELPVVRHAACVGIGPIGTQAIVVIVVTANLREGLADGPLTAAVRRASARPVAAVIERRELPVDIRHNSKVDRAALAVWAGRLLAGRGSAS